MLNLTQDSQLLPIESIEVSLDSPTTDQSISQEKDFLQGKGAQRVLNISSRNHLDRVVLLEHVHGLNSPQFKIDHIASEDVVPLDQSAVNIPNSIGSINLLGKSLHEWGGIALISLDRDSRMLRMLYKKVPGIKDWWREIQARAFHSRIPAAYSEQATAEVANNLALNCSLSKL